MKPVSPSSVLPVYPACHGVGAVFSDTVVFHFVSVDDFAQPVGSAGRNVGSFHAESVVVDLIPAIGGTCYLVDVKAHAEPVLAVDHLHGAFHGYLTIPVIEYKGSIP